MQAIQHVTHDFKFNKGPFSFILKHPMLKVKFNHTCTSA